MNRSRAALGTTTFALFTKLKCVCLWSDFVYVVNGFAPARGFQLLHYINYITDNNNDRFLYFRKYSIPIGKSSE